MTDQPTPEPRQPAYDAVFAFIRSQPRGFLPSTVVERNAMIWDAVRAALDAVGAPEGGFSSSPETEGRLTVDTITSDQLDALYEQLERAEQEANDSVAAASRLTVLVGKRAEKAEKAAKNQRSRAQIAETELRVLRAGLRANGADPTQIQNLWAQIRLRNRQWRDEKQRAEAASRVGTGYMAAAEKAEAAVQRVTALRDRWVKAGPPPLGTSINREWDKRLVELNAALNGPKEPCGAGSNAPNALGNERCTLPAGHDGRHAEGITTWPRDTARR